MKITIWGCRGSLPAPGGETLRFGGNTTCVEVRSACGQVFIIDAGSGLRHLGRSLCRKGEPKNIRFFFTHSHWDHLLGFPFFTPAYLHDYSLTFCAGAHAEGAIRSYLSHQMKAPFFPVELSLLRATVTFHCDNPCHDKRLCCFGGIQVEPFPVNHPNGGFGYKFIEDGKVFIFAPDNELGFPHEGGPSRADFVKRFGNADLLLHDAQYTDEEYRMTRGWGHSTYAETVDLALDAGVKRLGLFHHDPDRSDDDLDRQVGFCRDRIRTAGGEIDCFAAAEGMVIEL